MKQPVQILGAGFSGLVTAWALSRRGFKVEVHERSARAGGLIATPEHRLGSYETAANALLNTVLVEELFADLDLTICRPTPAAQKKYIYRGRPKRFPLTLTESAGTLFNFLKAKSRDQILPAKFETLEHWGRRVLGKPATEHLLCPGVQGIYAGDPSSLSASLLLRRLLQKGKGPKPKFRGSVFPKAGMEQLIKSLIGKIEGRGGKIFYNSSPVIEAKRPAVLAVSAVDASAALRDAAPEASALLGRIEMLPLVAVELFLPKADRPLAGFGCLFPANSGFHSLGVLFDHYLYPHRIQGSAERWILGGTRIGEIATLSDNEIVERVLKDHLHLGGQSEITGTSITRWPKALPYYTVELERILTEVQLPEDIYLIGNYLGNIGLSQILASAEELAKKLAATYDS